MVFCTASKLENRLKKSAYAGKSVEMPQAAAAAQPGASVQTVCVPIDSNQRRQVKGDWRGLT
jgi:hypothetical protein